MRAPTQTRDLPPQAEHPTRFNVPIANDSPAGDAGGKAPARGPLGASIPTIPAKAGTEAGTHEGRQIIKNVHIVLHLLTLLLSFLKLTPTTQSLSQR